MILQKKSKFPGKKSKSLENIYIYIFTVYPKKQSVYWQLEFLSSGLPPLPSSKSGTERRMEVKIPSFFRGHQCRKTLEGLFLKTHGLVRSNGDVFFG
jgi:hypothetical protein